MKRVRLLVDLSQTESVESKRQWDEILVLYSVKLALATAMIIWFSRLTPLDYSQNVRVASDTTICEKVDFTIERGGVIGIERMTTDRLGNIWAIFRRRVSLYKNGAWRIIHSIDVDDRFVDIVNNSDGVFSVSRKGTVWKLTEGTIAPVAELGDGWVINDLDASEGSIWLAGYRIIDGKGVVIRMSSTDFVQREMNVDSPVGVDTIRMLTSSYGWCFSGGWFLKWDGQRWNRIDQVEGGVQVVSIDGNVDEGMWAVGGTDGRHEIDSVDMTAIYRLQDDRWINNLLLEGSMLRSIVVFDQSNVWTVGAYGLILRWIDNEWQRVDVMVMDHWGFNAVGGELNNVWVGGTSGDILGYRNKKFVAFGEYRGGAGGDGIAPITGSAFGLLAMGDGAPVLLNDGSGRWLDWVAVDDRRIVDAISIDERVWLASARNQIIVVNHSTNEQEETIDLDMTLIDIELSESGVIRALMDDGTRGYIADIGLDAMSNRRGLDERFDGLIEGRDGCEWVYNNSGLVNLCTKVMTKIGETVMDGIATQKGLFIITPRRVLRISAEGDLDVVYEGTDSDLYTDIAFLSCGAIIVVNIDRLIVIDTIRSTTRTICLNLPSDARSIWISSNETKVYIGGHYELIASRDIGKMIFCEITSPTPYPSPVHPLMYLPYGIR